MKCQGKFKYKGFEVKEAGSFVNSQGQKVDYPSRYALKLDEIGAEGVFERVFKVPLENTIINQLSNKNLYDDVTIEFDIQFTSNGSVKITPINVIK